MLENLSKMLSGISQNAYPSCSTYVPHYSCILLQYEQNCAQNFIAWMPYQSIPMYIIKILIIWMFY